MPGSEARPGNVLTTRIVESGQPVKCEVDAIGWGNRCDLRGTPGGEVESHYVDRRSAERKRACERIQQERTENANLAPVAGKDEAGPVAGR